MRNLLGFSFYLALVSCFSPGVTRERHYHCTLILNDSIGIPVLMSMKADSAFFQEGAYPIERNGDSFEIEHPAFASVLRFRMYNDSISGYWYNLERGKYKLPFNGKRGTIREYSGQTEKHRYKCVFTEADGSTYDAIGLFSIGDSNASGTFLTESGDYRYLSGTVDQKRNSLTLYTFDFAQAYYFTARLFGDSISGLFYSGNHYTCHWSGAENDTAKLRDAGGIVGFDSGVVDFSFYDLNAHKHSLSDPEFRGKALIIQAFGSWCPNCYDESIFLNQIHNRIREQGIVLMGLAFEKMPDFPASVQKIKKYRNALSLDYPLYYGGESDKDSAAKVLSFLHNFESFPTLIFIDRKHRIVAVHSGFSGPGTGFYYAESRLIIGELIALLITPQ